MKLEYKVKKDDENMNIKDIVKMRLKVSARLTYRVFSLGLVLQNSKECFARGKIKYGDIITVDLTNSYLKEEINEMYSRFSPWVHDIDIIYEDDYILCINKEAGITCHPSANNTEHTLYQAVVAYYLNKGTKQPLHIINRLDKNTTGIVVFAKHKYVQELWVSFAKSGKIIKEYIAVCHGKLNNQHEIIEKRIKRKEGSIMEREITDDINEGQYAKTEYRVLNYNRAEDITILKIKLHTGRTHQIRVHLASIGHPIVGDNLYGIGDGRQLLHAWKLTIKDRKNIILKAKLPKDMENIGTFLRLTNS